MDDENIRMAHPVTSNQPCKYAWDPAESNARMTDWSAAGQFDPDFLHAFVDAIGIYPVGSLVRLKWGRLAVVTEQNAALALRPRVKVFFSTGSKLPIAPELVNLAEPHCAERIVGRESNEQGKFPYLADLLAGYAELRKGAAPAGR